jgi:hypothetical protein
LIRGNLRKYENNHTDKKVNVYVEDFSKELPQYSKTGGEGRNRT